MFIDISMFHASLKSKIVCFRQFHIIAEIKAEKS